MFDQLRSDGRPLIMGILNITPDSFSDGGCYQSTAAALAQAMRMIDDGADIIDIGGESSRPGAETIPDAEQLARIMPILRTLLPQLPTSVVVSIDTRSPVVAAAAIAEGAHIVNDITAGRAPGMLELIAGSGAALVMMHMQGDPATMQQQPHYADVVTEVRDFLLSRVDACIALGIGRERIAIDPGIGFGKNREHNLRLLAALPEFSASGCAVMLGTSRKRFMGAICAETDFKQLVGATCATTALGVAAGVRIFRVHDVKENRQAADVAWACRAYSQPGC